MLPPAMPNTMSMPASSSTRTIASAARVSAFSSLLVMRSCAPDIAASPDEIEPLPCSLGRVTPRHKPSGTPIGRALVGDDAAVDVVGLARDVARAGRGQEHDHRRDVLGVVGTPQ